MRPTEREGGKMVGERRDQDTIDREASRWLARQRLMSASERDAEEFVAWQAADPRHAAAFARMRRTLDEIASLRSLAELEPLDADAPVEDADAISLRAHRVGAETKDRARHGTRSRRRIAGAIAAMAAMVAVLVAMPYWWKPASVLDVATAVAQVRTLDLPDGSRVTLGGDSRIVANFGDGVRSVRLEAGQAFFEVARDPARPFVVEAGDTRVRVVGTRFDVGYGVDRVRVTVEQGTVEVREPAPILAEPARHVLHGGERIETRETSALLALRAPAPAKIHAVEGPVAAWRDGQLVYDGARLADVVADLNRYYRPGVRLTDAALGDERVAAAFRVDDVDAFLDNLPAALAVTVDRQPDGLVVIGRRR